MLVRVLLLLLVMIPGFIYAQNSEEMKIYLDNKQVSKAAKDFYSGKFKATDNDKTLSIIDSLRTKNSFTRPFYLYLVSKMMDKSDGALSEALGNSCKEFVEDSPNSAIEFLYQNNKIANHVTVDNWAKIIEGEFMIVCENDEKECVGKSLQKTLLKTKAANRSNVNDLYQRIKKYIH